MKYLIDTHIFIWYATGDNRLSLVAKEIIESYNTRFFSLASIWEMSIKSGIGKLDFQKPFEQFVRQQISLNDFKLLNISEEHLYLVEKLPQHHKDPFDRLLAAQCMVENIPLVSADSIFDSYPIQRIF
ncbi:MAG: type II toxin-antitoxin system VapC family toxin [Cytophagales bacterium]|nr:MAG: type II toxin-antitoxin system VapC family toxin [Cytophagales bacterium]